MHFTIKFIKLYFIAYHLIQIETKQYYCCYMFSLIIFDESAIP